MRRGMAPIVFAALVWAGAGQADEAREVPAGDCDPPAPAPAVPPGATATHEEMVRAQQAIRVWIADGEDYIVCLTELEASWQEQGVEVSEKRRQALVSDHNQIVSAMEEVAARFNEALRAYQQRAE